ncbi:alpha/beta fold hydrolase [Oceanobacillus sp. Castelsardo]|uniref:alpha/beta fold hydrolase n=1 Tax=Oceanobacillus sp. Castelsardo TaxID=1851204 RepID=UPI0008391E5D|nr:alpha/beta fold hydrolase [Oceanobacillus sp. Castelsardo]
MNIVNKDVVIDIQPKNSSIVESLSMKIYTNNPSMKYRIVTTTKDDQNKLFSSSATFITDEHGVIDLASQSPVEGDYNGVDPIGLMWSMKCKNKKEGMYVKHTSKPVEVEFQMYKGEQFITSKSMTRTFYSEDVEKEVIEENSIVGTVYYPKRAGHYPAILIVGGSDASVHESAAAMLASKGYVVLALAYFGRTGLPKGIENIPLEYVDRSIQYLISRSMVDKNKVGIIGHSRGSELALLYALHFQKVKAVIAVAPSAVVFPGVVNYQPVMKPAWTVQGSPIAYFKAKRTVGDTCSFFYHWIFRKPYSGLQPIKRNLQDEKQFEANAIPVQDIQAPMMFFAGTDDHIQPAAFFTKRMEEQLQHHPFKQRNRFIYHENAGHFSAFPSALPNLPQTTGDTNYNMTMVFGGTKKVNAKTAQDSWEQTLDFLKENLK